MKKIFNLLAISMLALGFCACEDEIADNFSSDPVAPVMNSHQDILMTSTTLAEDVEFTWQAYRNLPEGLTYTLYGEYQGTTMTMASTTGLYYKTDKASFQSALNGAFSLPTNDTFPLSVYVVVSNAGIDYKSDAVTVNIYVNADAVAPTVSLIPTEPVVLDATTPSDAIGLVSWTEARLVLGEAITYDLQMTVNGGAPYALAEGITGLSYHTTVDALNEAIVAAGGLEAEANQVVFDVTAVCASLPNGISASSEALEVTTYVSTFPDQYYMPGSYQGWDPASAPVLLQSSVTKGLFEGVVDLTTSDGSDVEFKFSPVPEWKDDFGGTVEVTTFAGDYAHASGTVGVSDNIKVPSGMYWIVLNKKFGTLEMVQFETLSLIGSAVGDYGWGSDVDLTYDADAKTFYVAETALKAGEFKLRFNHDWTYSMGGTTSAVSLTTGDNIASTKEGGYKVVLDVSGDPAKVKFIDLSFPENIYAPGGHNGWSFSTMFAGNGEGKYEGFATIGPEFKFTPADNWNNGDYTGTPVVDDSGVVTISLEDGSGKGNIVLSKAGYYKVEADFTTLSVTMTPISTVGIIGGFDGWASDYVSLSYDSESDTWNATDVVIPAGTEWKFRMNGGWDVNLGGDLSDLTQGGANIVEADGGTYDISLSIATTPYKATMTKK